MKISQDGIDILKHFEGCRLQAYPDPATGGAPWTIGYGHTGPEVKPGLKWTQAQADAVLLLDLASFEKSVASAVRVPLTQPQFDALVCFAYNVGIGNLQSSALLAKLNGRDYVGAQAQFIRWNKAAGKEMPGLTRRRKAEAARFGGATSKNAIACAGA